MKRQRGRSRRNNNQHNANRSMESNGPDVKVRGTAKQIFDKYESLARDAASSGNRVKAENFRQHAEHYQRILNAIEAAKEKAREEAETAKAEAGEQDEASDGETPKKENGRSRRKYPPQVRKGNEEEPGDAVEASDDSEGKTDDTEDNPVETTKKKTTRRRKAPSREKSDDVEAPVEAAE